MMDLLTTGIALTLQLGLIFILFTMMVDLWLRIAAWVLSKIAELRATDPERCRYCHPKDPNLVTRHHRAINPKITG